MIEIKIIKRLGKFNLNVAFDATEEGATIIFGPSGSGKSSILSTIVGNITPDEGAIKFGDKSIFCSERNINLPTRKRRIGYVHQNAILFPNMSVEENLIYGLKRALSDKGITFPQVTKVLKIENLIYRKVDNLSGGERQRIALGRALLSQPDLLLLDEPLAALDEAHKSEIIDFILNIKNNYDIPIIYVTHNKMEVDRLADKVIYIDKGEIVRTEVINSLNKTSKAKPTN